ncbi:MAG TPA: ABC transporter permease, partial [Casimicrobiaceae bacterium]|nr:ABC transporter permease [Casimicrobiaceae bacterium]
QTLSLLVIFAMLFYGAKAVIGSGAEHGGTLPSIVSGYFVWLLAVFGYSAVAQNLLEEATQGTLEQLAMSPLGLRTVVVTQFAASWLTQLGLLVAMFVLTMAISGQWLHIDIVSLVPLVLLTTLGVFGIGLITGGLALVFKRIQAFLQLLQFGFVALVAAPVTRLPWLKYLPLAWGNVLIREVMVGHRSIFSMPGGDLWFLLVHGVAWMGFGLAVFTYLERVARERALLGHY